VSGRVLDGNDQPVAGATVVMAHHLVLQGLGSVHGTVSSNGEQLRVDIDIPAGHVELTVQVEGIDGARIDTAQVLLLPGRVEVSTCVIPLAGDLHDPAFVQKLRKHTPHLKVYCQPLSIAATPDKQVHTTVVPPMEPFPPEPDPTAWTAP